MKLLEPLAGPALVAGEIALLSRRAVTGLFRPPLELRTWVREMDRFGVRSLGVAGITSLFTGMVLALQTAYSLPGLGIKYYIGTVVSKSLVRELAPVLVALIVGGRIGAGMTAELGSMKVTEQIDALRALAADPVRKLVVPRVAATTLALPLLTVFADILGVLGAMVVARVDSGVGMTLFLESMLRSVALEDVMHGLVKTVFDATSGELLGAHLIGPEVTELIQGFGLASTLEATEAELMHTVFAHPTLSEAMHESVLQAFGRAVHL